MFEIGFPELLLVTLVGLLVIGPDRLPGALRTLALWFGRIRRKFDTVKTSLEQEIGMDEIRRQLRNEELMAQFRKMQIDAKPRPTQRSDDDSA
jgi:sec-independent protein translocase protein TatB